MTRSSRKGRKTVRTPASRRVKNWLTGDLEDDRPAARQLLSNIKATLPDLKRLLKEAGSHWGYEDGIYRFYHQSWKVYGLQETTLGIVAKLKALSPLAVPLNSWFLQVVDEGTEREFKASDNRQWLPATRPILEAFFHARFFLEMAVKYGKELKTPPACLPSGWAAVLYLYNLR